MGRWFASRGSGPSIGLVVASMAAIYLIWGSTYLGIKLGLDGLPPFLLGAIRFAVAGGLMLAWAAARGTFRTVRLTARNWGAAALSGGLMLVGGNGAVTWAEQHIASGLAALLVATVPLWMALLERARFGRRLGPLAVGGLVLGFVGVGVLVSPSGDVGAPFAGGVIIAGALAWAAGSLYTRDADLPARPVVATGMQMVSAAGIFLVLAAVGGEFGRFDPGSVTTASLAAVAYLAVFGSIVAFSAYTWLLRQVPSSIVATYAYVNPVVAVALGWVVLGEALSSRTLVAASIIVAAVALIVRGRDSAAREPVDPGDAGEQVEVEFGPVGVRVQDSDVPRGLHDHRADLPGMDDVGLAELRP